MEDGFTGEGRADEVSSAGFFISGVKDCLQFTVGEGCVVHGGSLGFLGDGEDLVSVGVPVGGRLVLVYEVVGDVDVSGAVCDRRARERAGAAECGYLGVGEGEAGERRTAPERVGAEAGHQWEISGGQRRTVVERVVADASDRWEIRGGQRRTAPERVGDDVGDQWEIRRGQRRTVVERAVADAGDQWEIRCGERRTAPERAHAEAGERWEIHAGQRRAVPERVAADAGSRWE